MAAESKEETIINVREELTEIVDVTEINACFILNTDENVIVQSIESFSLGEDILWELSVLKDTFQQFASGIKHGSVKDLSLEGDKGFIFLYNLSDKYTLIAIAPESLHLPYLKLAMFDIIKRMETKIEAEERRVKVLEELRMKEVEERLKKEEEERQRIEAEARKKAEEERKKIEAEIKRKEEERKRIEEQLKKEEEERKKAEEERLRKEAEEQKRIEEERKKLEEELKKKAEEEAKIEEAEARKKAEEERKKLEAEIKKKEEERKKAEEERKRIEEQLKKEEEERKKKALEEQKRIEEELRKEQEERAKLEALKKKEEEEEAKRKALEELKQNAEPKITALIKSIAETEQKKRIDILSDVLALLKDSIKFLTGEQLGNILTSLKDSILENIGTSLALYDISKNAREFMKIKEELTLKQVSMLKMSIDKWAERLIKK